MDPNHQSPAALTEGDATWVRSRRRALVDRLASHDLTMAVSSGCAATGAARHAGEIEVRAARALERLLAGLTETCEECGGSIPRERLDAVLTATRCVPCAGSGTVDTKWCR
jgi:RNA polymerase-binding transcription factor DksA